MKITFKFRKYRKIVTIKNNESYHSMPIQIILPGKEQSGQGLQILPFYQAHYCIVKIRMFHVIIISVITFKNLQLLRFIITLFVFNYYFVYITLQVELIITPFILTGSCAVNTCTRTKHIFVVNFGNKYAQS